MPNIIDLAKWSHSRGHVPPVRSNRRGIGDRLDDIHWEYIQKRHPLLNTAFVASGALRQNIRKTGTALAEEFRVFVYAGGISDNLDELDRDLRALRAAIDLLKNRSGGKGFHVVLGNHEQSAWINHPRFGWTLTLTTNFAIDEAARLIEQSFAS